MRLRFRALADAAGESSLTFIVVACAFATLVSVGVASQSPRAGVGVGAAAYSLVAGHERTERAERGGDRTPVATEAGSPADAAPAAPPAHPSPPAPPSPPPPVPALPLFATAEERQASLVVSGQGWDNGRLPDEALVYAAPACRLLPSVARALVHLGDEAVLAGHLVELNDCYRDYETQMAMKWDWCVKGACHYAAVPGHSSHGHGLAVDLRVNGRRLTWDSPAFAWLTENGPRFGFRQPDWALPGGTTPEPWHWEYFGPLDH